MKSKKRKGFGTAAVYFTAISSILGAILFLRLGMAAGTLGFWGAATIIVLGHLITIPTALAVSELATNTRVEGGGEYYIISRSFGLKMGTTIGLALYLSQTISIAFYTIAFAEAFQPLFRWCAESFGVTLPHQAVSVPALIVLSWIMLRKGAGSGMVMLYTVTFVLFVSLMCFFMGDPVGDAAADPGAVAGNFGFFGGDRFFLIFAICFPAFTGMTAGVGLSGDLRNPSRSIPLGTMLGTLTGLAIYLLVVWKLSVSATSADLAADQLIMARIALWGAVIIPAGLAAATASSAIGAMMVAPRTLQAIGADRTLPVGGLNRFFARGRGENREPRNASVVSFAIALVFVALGDVDSVAGVISMFFLITYGTLCLSSFLNHFGAPPSYRPRFRSRWYLSLAGFLLSVWVMFMIDPLYTVVAYGFIVLIYIFVEHYNKDKKGLVNIFKGALFQLNRQIQVYMQKHQSEMEREEWRPAVLCISSHSFERDKILELMKWLSYHHGFGTYFHFIEGYYSRQKCTEAQERLELLIRSEKERGSALYIDTMISPSYTSAIAQAIQSPSISGMENNLVLFEYDRRHPGELDRIVDNVNLVKAGNFDVCIYAMSDRPLRPENGIHVWIRDADEMNTNFMILLGYIIISHPEWKRSPIKILLTSRKGGLRTVREELKRRLAAGRLPITMTNIEIVVVPEDSTVAEVVAEISRGAGLTLVGFREEIVKHDGTRFFTDFTDSGEMGDILFVNASQAKEID